MTFQLLRVRGLAGRFDIAPMWSKKKATDSQGNRSQAPRKLQATWSSGLSFSGKSCSAFLQPFHRTSIAERRPDRIRVCPCPNSIEPLGNDQLQRRHSSLWGVREDLSRKDGNRSGISSDTRTCMY